MNAVKNSMIFLDFKNNSPIVFFSMLAWSHMSPVEPVVMSAFLGIDSFKKYILELSLEVVIDQWHDKVEMTLNIALINFDLLEAIVRVGMPLMVVMMMLVVMLVTHLIFNYSPFIEDLDFNIIPSTSPNFEFQSSDKKIMILTRIFIKEKVSLER